MSFKDDRAILYTCDMPVCYHKRRATNIDNLAAGLHGHIDCARSLHRWRCLKRRHEYMRSVELMAARRPKGP